MHSTQKKLALLLIWAFVLFAPTPSPAPEEELHVRMNSLIEGFLSRIDPYLDSRVARLEKLFDEKEVQVLSTYRNVQHLDQSFWKGAQTVGTFGIIFIVGLFLTQFDAATVPYTLGGGMAAGGLNLGMPRFVRFLKGFFSQYWNHYNKVSRTMSRLRSSREFRDLDWNELEPGHQKELMEGLQMAVESKAGEISSSLQVELIRSSPDLTRSRKLFIRLWTLSAVLKDEYERQKRLGVQFSRKFDEEVVLSQYHLQQLALKAAVLEQVKTAGGCGIDLALTLFRESE